MTMEDDTMSADVPSPPSEPPTVVKFVLPNAYCDDEDHYAVTNFPKTYKDATIEAVRLLGRYMIDPTPENTTLRCSTKNREGQWVWADIPPEDWEGMINRFGSNEVGVFEDKLSLKKSTREFVDGDVMLSAGKVNGSQLEWTKLLHGHGQQIKQHTLMSRPKNYKEAVDFVKDMIRSNDEIGYFYAASFNKPARESFAKSLTTFKFFYFLSDTNTKTRVEFPPAAYTDDEYWRSIVPLPGSILGVIVE